MGFVNVWRVIGLWQQSDLLIEAGANPNPRVHLIISAAWAIVFIVSAALIFLRKPLARFIPLALFLYSLYRTMQLNQLGQSEGIVIHLIGYTAITAAAIWSLNRPAARRYFAARS